MFLFYRKWSYAFSFANEQGQQNDPSQKHCVSLAHIYISDGVGSWERDGGGAPFFNRSALSPCGHRSKATMGLMKTIKSTFCPYEGATTAVLLCALVTQSVPYIGNG